MDSEDEAAAVDTKQTVEGYFHLHPYLELWQQQRLRQQQSSEE